MKKMPKKKKDDSQINLSKASERNVYENYLTHHHHEQKGGRAWTKILNSSDDKQGKALQLQI